MAITQDTSSITAAAEAHISSYATVLTSSDFKSSAERGAKMATYYLPSISFFVEGKILALAGESSYAPLISGSLEKIEGLPEVKGHRIEAVGENSAIIWLSLEVKGVEMSIVYFFRRMEDGTEGFEGGIVDGEMWLLRQVAKK